MKISRMSLGTVQLGLDYGVANKIGKPSVEDAHAILKSAMDSGVTVFDTAQFYGNSEEIIGSFIASNDASPIIVTKIPKVECDPTSPFENIYDHVKSLLEDSAKRLNLSQIPICLLHRAIDMTDYDGKVTKSLVKLREESLVRLIGASIYEPGEVRQLYEPGEVRQFLEIAQFDAIQVPINVFDHRLIKSGLLDELKNNNIIVFVRSVFLKGLFFLDPENLPWYIQIASEPLRGLQKLSADSGIGIAQLALTFVRDLPGITSILLGVETADQLKDNVELMNSPPLPDEVRSKIFKIFPDLSAAQSGRYDRL